MSMIVVLHEVLLMVILPMLLPLIKEGFFLIKIIPLFDWLAQRPKYFKNYVIKNPELFQDTPDLAEDFDSPICLAYTTDKMVTIFKNVIPCFWQRYSWKLIWSDLKKSWQSSFWSPSKRKWRNLHHVMLCFGHTFMLCYALTLPCFSWKIYKRQKILALQLIPHVLETKRRNLLFTCQYSLSLFIRYYL